jgi:hypothetical protein
MFEICFLFASHIDLVRQLYGVPGLEIRTLAIREVQTDGNDGSSETLQGLQFQDLDSWSQWHSTSGKLFFLIFIFLLFICAYNAWVISAPCPHWKTF